ncbi:MAG: hypothetical protein QF803_09300 [Gammaproteobacteria bacterium]|nr:hypothetical protein [Gammaproteobacteria bacterium]
MVRSKPGGETREGRVIYFFIAFIYMYGDRWMNKLHIVLLSALLVPVGATSADLDLELGGFIWTEVGTGDRYDDSDDDQTGVSKAGITVSTSVDNVSAGLTLGVDGMINEDLGSDGSASDDDLEVKEAWVAFDFEWADVTIGKQALGFGLKPAGWVGGRPINDGLEFDGSDVGRNNSGQVVTGIAADMALGDFTVRGVMFDSSDSDGGDHSMSDNWMLQLRSDDLFGSGLYASAGYQETVFAGIDTEVESIGAGYDFGWADISLEHQEAEVDGFPEQEFLIIAVGIPVSDSTGVYIDYATGEIDGDDSAETTRIGVTHAYNDNVDIILEWSDDDYDDACVGACDDTDSIDLRIALGFE